MKTSLKLIAATFAFSILLSSCKKEEEEAAVVSDTPKEIILPRVQPIPTGGYTTPAVQQQQVQQQQVQQQQQVVSNGQAFASIPVVTKAGMNPPHGQAGHRCDIQVGAPLSSKPAAASVTPGSATSKKITMPAPTMSTTQNGAPSILQTTATPATTAPGMNPAHGQEGHRCDVAVGAALPK
ncbi:hypothetical protein [Flavobacterium sp.]